MSIGRSPGPAEAPPDAAEATTSPMARRAFLGAAGAGLLTACAGPETGAGPAVATTRTVQWRLASTFPRGLDGIWGSAERLAAKLEALTDGRFRIRPYPAGELVPPFSVLDAAQQGTVQVGHTAGYYYTGKNPVLAFDTGVPFGLTSRQQTAWLMEGGGLDLMRSAYADFNVVNFPAGNTGAQMGGWFKREISTLADLRGLKMRIPGMGGEVMNRLGVTVQVLAGGDIYPALERGAIDATEWVGPYDDEKLGLQRAARFYYYPGWWEPGPSMSFLVNRQAWDALPQAYQTAFEVAAAWAAQSTQAVYDVKNPEALARLVAGGTQLRRFSDAIMAAARTQAGDLLAQQATRDAAGYGRVYQAWRKFRADSQRWFATAEQEYSSFVLRQT
ncbi:MAG TPA: TRAP transporter substrate-binding protein DctP [Longimicrobiales bacterium]|nr:TRAP transporter substrate-binding protein DctP [Longimicrobiales bacterium]